MRQLRPELYSDTIDRTTYKLDAPTLGYHLETITARNQTHDFEIFCRNLCERTICPNLKPPTGPEGGGDSRADTETIPIADEIGVLTYVGDANAGRERWAFAFSASFHDFDEFERFVDVARSEALALLVVLLGGEAGLRCGEMMALEWTDIDFAKRQLTVARSEWKGHVTMPKGGRIRYVPMTRRLTEALREARHLRGPRVLSDGTGKPLTQKVIQVLVRRTARRANVRHGIHVLRHTFCSHLVMRGAPARAIQELAGHQDLGTGTCTSARRRSTLRSGCWRRAPIRAAAVEK